LEMLSGKLRTPNLTSGECVDNKIAYSRVVSVGRASRHAYNGTLACWLMRNVAEPVTALKVVERSLTIFGE